jgi:hypothetical protein
MRSAEITAYKPGIDLARFQDRYGKVLHKRGEEDDPM